MKGSGLQQNSDAIFVESANQYKGRCESLTLLFFYPLSIDIWGQNKNSGDWQGERCVLGVGALSLPASSYEL